MQGIPPPARPTVLALNGGSSSIRFALYETGAVLRCRLHGKLDRIGQPGASLRFERAEGEAQTLPAADASDHGAAARFLLRWFETQDVFDHLSAAGHRVVHGMSHTQPEIVTPVLLSELRRIEGIDPEHLPAEIGLIEAVQRLAPKLPQVACFDTAFHSRMPRVATLLALPRRYEAQGVRRYGFHGLSYAYLMEELERIGGAPAAQGRVILAHLGNGASLAAVQNGVGIDTSMGFTPAAGVPMGTRSGDLDPGLARYLERTEYMNARQYDAMVNHASGLLGISETSSDLRDLLANEAGDVRAAEAVALFCYQVKKWIGAYAAALGGLDTLVFAGGIGENAVPVRQRICEGLGFLGLELDATRNAASEAVVSSDSSAVTVRVIRSDEALMIARSTARVIGLASRSGEVLP